MLRSLQYGVTFPTTGRSLAADVVFENGFGTISGPNESGKSMIVEMVRYCLFGSSALRGKAEDYKALKAKLGVTIKGTEYTIERNGRNATLYEGTKAIVTGQNPVTKKVVELLGFGRDVFDTACIANQGDIEKLGDMVPAERKRLVDSVIGIAAIDELAKWAGEEALVQGKQADAIERTLFAPSKPDRPDPYIHPDFLRQEIATLEKQQAELNQLKGWLSQVRQEPKAPKETISLPSEALKPLADQQAEAEAKLGMLTGELRNLPMPSEFTDAQLDAMLEQWAVWDDWNSYAQWFKRNPVPEYTVEQLEQWEKDWNAITVHGRYRTLLHQVDTEPKVECPECGCVHPVSEALSDARDEFEAKHGAILVAPKPENPPLRHDQIPLYADYVRSYAPPIPALPAEPIKPDWTRQEILKLKLCNSKAARRSEILTEIADLETFLKGKSFKEQYHQRLAYEQTMAHYVVQKREYEAWQLERLEKQAKAKRLEDVGEVLLHHRNMLDYMVSYEAALANYEKQLTHYETNSTLAVEHRKAAENWKKVKDAMVTLRGLIKQHLVPSLNKVASRLLREMTGGQRQSVMVDEDFEISVDGQPLNTLSGSGKAVVNLALRIGLGQVLTNNVMSLFVGDEIDASMDQIRAENTASSLRNLTNQISQIILVSHKYHSADYQIGLSDNKWTNDFEN